MLPNLLSGLCPFMPLIPSFARLLPQQWGSSFALSKALSIMQRKVCDILIIGGGPMGSSTAHHLSKALGGTAKIVVLEKDFRYRHASAMLSAGGIRQQFSVKENILMSKYGAEFLKNPQRLAVNGEVPDWQFHENGYLFLSGEKSKHVLEANNKTQRECGVDWIKLMDRQGLAQRFQWLHTDDLALGSFGEQNEGYFDPWMYVNALKRKNISEGVEYIEGDIASAKLLPVVAGSNEFNVDEVSFRRSGSTNPETIHASTVINCAGAWSGRLLKKIASNLAKPQVVHPLPVTPRKRCIFTFHCKASPQMPPVKTPLTIDPSGVYFRPEGVQGGRFICGVSPDAKDDHDIPEGQEEDELRNVDHALFEDVIWPVLYERVPAFQEIKVTSSWAGYYDVNTLDENAIIGRHSELRNMVLCTGFSGHGLQQSPAAGRAVAELIVDKKFTSIDVTRFGFERIVNKSPIFETGIV